MRDLHRIALAAFCVSLTLSTSVFAQSSDLASGGLYEFGGHDEKFGGDGDLVPPQCKLQAPNFANDDFFVSWSCDDNDSPSSDLVSELWMRRSSNTPFKRVSSNLGFPASVQVTVPLLESLPPYDETSTVENTMETLLPVQLRLLVRDKGGPATISESIMVQAGSSESLSCAFSINTELVEATDAQTGTPALFVSSNNFDAEVLSTSTGRSAITSSGIELDLCEISTLCPDGTDNYGVYTQAIGDSASEFVLKKEDDILFTTQLLDTSSSSTITMDGTGEVDGSQVTVRLSCTSN